MKNKLMVLLSGLMLLVTSQAAAQDVQAPAAEPTQEAVVEPAAPVKVGNKICPVSGQEVGSMGEGAEIEYNGKIYSLCCAGCIRDFNKDPEKYSKIADEMMASEAAEEETEGAASDHEGHHQ